MIRLLAEIFASPNVSQSKSFGILSGLFNGQGETILPALGRLHRAFVWENMLLKSSVPKGWYETKSKKSQQEPNATLSRTVGMEGAEVSGLESQTASHDPNQPEIESLNAKDYRMHNTAFFRHIFTEIPLLLNQLYSGLLRIISNRRLSDQTKSQITHVTDSLAKMLNENLTLPEIELLPSQSDRLSYYSFALGTVAALMIDDQLHMSLHTSLVLSYFKCGLVDTLLKISANLWSEAASLEADENMNGDEHQDRVKKVHGLLDLCFAIFTSLTDNQAISSSPYTANLLTKKEVDFFDPHSFVVNLRLKVFPFITDVWKSEYMAKCPKAIAKSVLTIVIQVLKAQGEIAPKISSGAVPTPVSATSQLLGRALPAFQPDEEKIQQLVDMGYPRGAAEIALQRCGNNVARAVDYLISHPSIIANAMFSSTSNTRNSGASAESSSQTAEPASTNPQLPTSETSMDPPREAAAEDSTASSAASNVNPEATAEALDAAEDADNDELALALAMSMAPSTDGSLGETTAMQTDNEGHSNSTEEIIAPKSDTMNEDSKEKEKVSSVTAEHSVSAEKSSLDALREAFRQDMVSRALEIMTSVEGIVHSIRDLIWLLKSEELRKTVFSLFEKVQSELISNGSPTNVSDMGYIDRRLAVELHFLTVVFNSSDEKQDNEFIESVNPLAATLLQSLINFESYRVDAKLPKWLCSGLLLLDAILVVADEPGVVDLKVDEDGSIKLSGDKIQLRPLQVEMDDRKALISSIAALMDEDLDENTLHATLRVAVRLTRSHTIALEFLKVDGLKHVCNPKKLASFPAHLTLSYMLLRHIVESPEVLKFSMEEQIKTKLSNRTRLFDLLSFLKAAPYFPSRDPDVFVETMTSNCHIENYNPADSNEFRLIAWNDNKADKDSANITEMAIVNQASETVLTHLLTELVSLKTSPANEGSTDEVRKRTTELCVRRAFLLRCIGELVYSFPSCRVELLNISQRKPTKGTPYKSPRNPLLSHLFNDLIPRELEAGTKSDDIKPEVIVSECASFVIFALCSELPPRLKDNAEQANARKSIIDSIMRTFKDALATTSHLETKYTKFACLADLCQWILTKEKGDVPHTSVTVFDDSASSIHKAMLEKGFVNLLTSVLADIDANHPKAKDVTISVLKPLEFLTKIALKMARTLPLATSEGKDGNTKPAVENDAPVDPMELIENDDGDYAEDIQTEDPDQSAISDIYRNSSLGMFNARETDDEDEEHDEVGFISSSVSKRVDNCWLGRRFR
jgi:E3 ubiquitin-protein ligase HUWE1